MSYNTPYANAAQELVRKFIEECQQETNPQKRVKINSVRELHRILTDKYANQKDVDVPPLPSLYKYVRKMGFYIKSPTKYGFHDTSTKFDNTLIYMGYRKHLCFFLKDPSIGPLLANIVNQHYTKKGDGSHNYLHCVVLQELLICFYTVNNELNINSKTLENEIPEILSKYYYDTKK